MPYEIWHIRFVLADSDATLGGRGRRIEYRLQPDRPGGQAHPAEAGTLYAVPWRFWSPVSFY